MNHNDIFDHKQADQEALATLRKESIDIFNRLRSIEEDIVFVNRVRDHYLQFPLVRNLRCGAWYADPAFVSHYWAPETKRKLGFQLEAGEPSLIASYLQELGVGYLHVSVKWKFDPTNSLILVDSTRAGKRMPDALSKTVPIWCSVVNRAIKARRRGRGLVSDQALNWDIQLYTPPGVVSAQEHHQITEKLDGWAKALAESSFEIPVDLSVPLRPLWITPLTTNFPVLDAARTSPDFLPLICVSASKQVNAGTERRAAGYVYVQGSGDDHELWGMGLTPQIFWKYRRELVATPRANLEGLIKRILTPTLPAIDSSLTPPPTSGFQSAPTSIRKINGRIQLASFSPSDLEVLVDFLHSKEKDDSKTAYIILDFSPPRSSVEGAVGCDANHRTTSHSVLHIMGSPKIRVKPDAHFLQHVIPVAIPFIKLHLFQESPNNICIFEGCGNDPGTRLDISVGLSLVAIQLFFDQNGGMVRDSHKTQVNKQSIRKRLEWIIESEPRANPSRATLKRVNEFLLTPPQYLSHSKT